MRLHPFTVRAFLLAVGLLASQAGADAATPQVAFPPLRSQLAAARAVPGQALDRLIRANQDFGLLRNQEASDQVLLPPWLRVWWRKNHPQGTYDGSDPTGGYPLALREVLQWMMSHQDLIPGPGAGNDRSAALGPESASISGELRISGAQTTPRSTSDIRVNPWNRTRLVAASNNTSASGQQAQFYSTDGGATWGQTQLSLQPGDTLQVDPTVEWTSDGTAWSITLGFGSDLRLRSYKSIDNGATWTFDATLSGTQIDTDKQMIWVDHSDSSPFKDNLYAIWHDGSPVFVNRRTGPGGSWQTPLRVSGSETTGTGIGGDIKSNAAGEVFAFWPDSGSRRVFAAKSANGAASFGIPLQLAQTFDSFDIGVPSFAGRRALIYVSGGAFRTLAKNLVYATWTDLTGASGCAQSSDEPGANTTSTCKTRVWFTRSTDGGASWEAARMLNDQVSKNDQFNQWMTVDEVTGAVAIIYYDTVGDAGRKKADVWYQSSFDDGVTWNGAVKVTSASTDETLAEADAAQQYGDYNGLSGGAGVFFPSWTDRRSNAREEIWTAKITDIDCVPPGAPTIGAASATGANQLRVTWSTGAPASATFNAYRAFGTCASPGPFSAAASALGASPFDDDAVSGGSTYAYRVTGVDVTGRCESAPSGCVEATATGDCTLPPSFSGIAAVVNAASATCTNHLSWNAGTANCGGPVRYSVYRGLPGFVPDGSNRIATSLVATTYDDTDTLFDGATYEYVVRALDVNNGVADLNAVRRSATPTGPVTFGTFDETFETGGGFDHPGWTHAALSGTTDWALSESQSRSPIHSWFSSEQTGDRVLVSPPFVARAGTTLGFWHAYSFEFAGGQCFDGGTLEYTTNGTEWTVLPDALFTAGGFNGTVTAGFGNPIGGQRAWCGGTLNPMTEVTADLSSLAGNTVRLRWHEGDDSGGSEVGWYLDSVSLSSFGTPGVCSTISAATNFFTLAPCRILDTRNANGALGGPALAPSSARGFAVAGVCGIPADAVAVSVNLTVASPGSAGFITAYPAAIGHAPPTSLLNFKPGLTRANNAVLMLATDGTNDLKVVNGSTGTVHLIVDVNGYFK